MKKKRGRPTPDDVEGLVSVCVSLPQTMIDALRKKHKNLSVGLRALYYKDDSDDGLPVIDDSGVPRRPPHPSQLPPHTDGRGVLGRGASKLARPRGVVVVPQEDDDY